MTWRYAYLQWESTCPREYYACNFNLCVSLLCTYMIATMSTDPCTSWWTHSEYCLVANTATICYCIMVLEYRVYSQFSSPANFIVVNKMISWALLCGEQSPLDKQPSPASIHVVMVVRNISDIPHRLSKFIW